MKNVQVVLILVLIIIAFANPHYITIILKSVSQVFMITVNWLSGLIGSMDYSIPSNW